MSILSDMMAKVEAATPKAPKKTEQEPEEPAEEELTLTERLKKQRAKYRR